MPRGIHFDIAADDPEKAVTLLPECIRLEDRQVRRDNGLLACNSWIPKGNRHRWRDWKAVRQGAAGRSVHTVITFCVPSADEFIERIRKAGGNVIMPKTPIPRVGYVA
jgi:hypothetical protein